MTSAVKKPGVAFRVTAVVVAGHVYVSTVIAFPRSDVERFRFLDRNTAQSDTNRALPDDRRSLGPDRPIPAFWQAVPVRTRESRRTRGTGIRRSFLPGDRSIRRLPRAGAASCSDFRIHSPIARQSDFHPAPAADACSRSLALRPGTGP